MKKFFGEDVLLHTEAAKRLYDSVKALPVVDIHCHLDRKAIAADARFSGIGELWLSGDHYKWRAMRMLGVDEKYITGDASYREKFIKYAEILPKLVGSPLYYWTHFELKKIFGINAPLDGKTAEYIYERADKALSALSVRGLLKLFDVEYVATTDDPIDDVGDCGVYGKTRVAPTFRPDRLFAWDNEYIRQLGKTAGVAITTLDGLCAALGNRLDHFASHGCKMTDHGFSPFPRTSPTAERARELFSARGGAAFDAAAKEALNGYMLVWLAHEYARRGMTMQLHFAVTRNVNADMFGRCGADSGFDVSCDAQPIADLIAYLDAVGDAQRPETVLYTLNDANLSSVATAVGAFRKVRMGAAWWFNDTLGGIRRNLETIAEYSALGSNLGMLTDSRSFSSYSRIDFFRRILCDMIGEKVERGEYDEGAAFGVVADICYNNAKRIIS